MLESRFILICTLVLSGLLSPLLVSTTQALASPSSKKSVPASDHNGWEDPLQEEDWCEQILYRPHATDFEGFHNFSHPQISLQLRDLSDSFLEGYQNQTGLEFHLTAINTGFAADGVIREVPGSFLGEFRLGIDQQGSRQLILIPTHDPDYKVQFHNFKFFFDHNNHLFLLIYDKALSTAGSGNTEEIESAYYDFNRRDFVIYKGEHRGPGGILSAAAHTFKWFELSWKERLSLFKFW